MSYVITRPRSAPKLNRFAWLMGLYQENYGRLVRVFHPDTLSEGVYASSVGDGLDLRLDVLARHAYTVELRLSYGLIDPVTGEPDPSAYLRLYRDARQVEATHCYVGRRWQDVVGLHAAPAEILDHRLRMNTFLGKWLLYLGERGHGVGTLAHLGPLADADCEALNAVRASSPKASLDEL
jgi:uncharacterized protein